MHIETSPSEKAQHLSPYPCLSVKILDRGLSIILLLLLSPLLLIRSATALIKHQRLLDTRIVLGSSAKPFALYQFAGRHKGRSLALLFNLVRGEISWLGPQPHNKRGSGVHNPGVFSSNDMQRRTGIINIDDTVPEYSIPASAVGYLKLLTRTLLVTLFTGARTRPLPQQVNLMGVSISNHKLSEILDSIFNCVENKQKRFIPFVNAHCFNIARKNTEYNNILRRAKTVLPDGSGVRLACRFHGLNLKDNLNGTDLFPHLCQRAAREGVSIYLLGAAEGIAEQAANKMLQRYPHLKIAGTRNGFFSTDENDEVINTINRSGAGILLVAMGVPQQEIWLDHNLEKLHTQVNLAVGGLFDFYAERISRAPLWLRELGMEWCWRLLQEPGRMWRRYILGNPAFIMHSLFDARRHSIIRLVSSRNTAALKRLSWWLRQYLSRRAKRLMDIFAASTLLLLLSPLLIITALMIRSESPGPVFFQQQRVGLRGKHFNFIKFRSMYMDAEQRLGELSTQNEMKGGVLFKMKNDPRITRVGKFIRRYSIDELPQLWNVLRGDMSLVGPRPALTTEVECYSNSDRYRLHAAPGITCIWQVSGRSTIPFKQQVEMDVEYIHKASLTKDISLLLKTVPCVISGHGAY